jgi:amino acid permease
VQCDANSLQWYHYLNSEVFNLLYSTCLIHISFRYLAGINVLAGVGLLSTPFTIHEAGWTGLAVLLCFAIVCCYTGILLKHCFESKDGISSYPDIGEAAFGRIGRLLISVSFCVSR